MIGVYIHIPFCASRCTYCDFYSNVGEGSRMSVYLGAVCDEAARRSSANPLWRQPVATLYIGGGTPSLIPVALLEALMASLRQTLDMSAVEEATIEVNPDDVTLPVATAWRRMGFNRVSMGVQSLVDAELRAIGRRHDADGAMRALATLRQAGFDNVSADLIYGLPGQTIDTLRYSLRCLIDAGVNHVSAYNLSYEPGTVLWRQRERGEVTEASDELCIAMYTMVVDMLEHAGYEHYEISNFALPGCHSRHNSGYWDYTPYLGLGAGAHGFDGNNRYYNRQSLIDYIASDVTVVEHLTADEHYNEWVMLGLRTARGIDLDRMSRCLGHEATQRLLDAAAPLIASGKLLLDGGRLKLARTAVMVSDDIMSDLFV